MRSVSDTLLFAAAGSDSALILPAIGEALEGGFYAGLISYTANGVATHALIVAPRATGASGTGYPLTTNYAWKPSTSVTAGTQSLFDGRANTDAMIAAGIAAHPAAQFCVNLTIGGFTDWYMPAPLEYQIAYFNLKPDTTSNNTSYGINAYAVPARASNYTAGTPPRSSVTKFQSGNSEAFAANAHWASAEGTTPVTAAWEHHFNNGLYDSNQNLKNTALRVRAFRKIAL